MIRSDFHLHTSHSSDSKAPMESMILKAVDLGLTKICFTEHQDYDYPENDEHFDFLLDTQTYKKELFTLKDKYKDHIQVLFGTEIGLMPTTYDKCSDFARSENFDFIIGSTHIVDQMDPYESIFFETYPGKQGLTRYLEVILENIQTYHDYCVYGHLDYAVRYCPDKNYHFVYKDYADLIEEILRTVIEDGKGIEVNTGGYKYGLGYPNPHPDVLKRYRELGGEILTIGSDGHCPEHMAYDFSKLPDLLTSVGFRYYTVFKDQKPEFIKL